MRRMERIRLARRRAGLSQQALAHLLGVRRSAVANWESVNGASPSTANLERLACELRVAHEWLATGRGEMHCPDHRPRSDADPVDADLAENAFERRLLRAWRGLPAIPRAAVLELVEAYPRV